MEQKGITHSIEDIKKNRWDNFLYHCNQVVPGFEVDIDNKDVVNKIFQYAFRYPEFESTKDYSLNKGLLLTGNVGSGKTELMKILQRVLLLIHSPLKFKLTTTWKLGEDYTQEGYEIMHRLKGHYMFDELGIKEREQVKYMGNSANIAEVIIHARYDLFKQNQTLTHFTTNLSCIPELKEYLGDRAYDRLIEMCNVVPLQTENLKSRRRTAVAIPVLKQKEETESKGEKISWLEFLKKQYAERGNLDHIPFTMVYQWMCDQYSIIHNQDLFDALYLTKIEVVRTELEQQKKRCNDSLVRREIENKILCLSDGNNQLVNREVCKHLILEAIQ